MSVEPRDEFQRVTMIAPGDLFGGAERQILTLCGAHGRAFWIRLILAFEGPLAAHARRAGIPVTVLFRRGQSILAEASRLRQLVLSERSDVLHLHGYRASVMLAVGFAGRHRLLPAIVKTVHGAHEVGAIGTAWRSRLYSLLELWADRVLDGTAVYVSRDLLEQLSPRNRKSCVVIYNGAVEQSKDGTTRPPEYPNDRANLLILGRLDRVKNVAIALQAMADAELRRSAMLHIVGDGPERAGLGALSQSLGLNDVVRFHGFKQEPLPFLSHADLLLVPSLHEGIPYTVLEAMQQGVAIVAANVGGIPEILEHNRTALLIDRGDVSALRSAVSSLIRNHSLRKELANSAAEQFRLHWTSEIMISAYCELYRSVAGN